MIPHFNGEWKINEFNPVSLRTSFLIDFKMKTNITVKWVTWELHKQSWTWLCVCFLKSLNISFAKFFLLCVHRLMKFDTFSILDKTHFQVKLCKNNGTFVNKKTVFENINNCSEILGRFFLKNVLGGSSMSSDIYFIASVNDKGFQRWL